MTRSLFGTDGIRGRANSHPMTATMALQVAQAAGAYFQSGQARRHVAVIGKDTRLSGYMIEAALTAGLLARGMDVLLVGPLPTPAIAMLTRSMRADVGIMVSASHNPYEDNGIKLFGPDGFKLSDDAEAEITRLILEPETLPPLVDSSKVGRAKRLEDAGGRYIEFAKSSFPRGLQLDGLKIAIDCANGAAYRVAPTVLRELGAEVIPLAVSPDGTNINRDCGATAVANLATQTVAHGAHIGIALDGDADRLIVVDEAGQVIDGDQIMALIATAWARAGLLRGGGIAATVMSNMGLEKHVQSLGLGLHRTKVGDRYVLEAMRAEGFNVGGEQSGHLILTDYATTGDGLIAALQVLACLVEAGRKTSELARVFKPYPQILKNIRYAPGEDPLALDPVQAAIAAAEARLGGAGRLLIRKSGTEPLIRVMAEGEDPALVVDVVDSVITVVASALAKA
ncbi:phosphoglucosamine mutase [Elstera cyanobacteriorum]|uniref:Phosphoglucosamine mutase n=1 Tax=Elstera cyanobacteriorum TaxID=2022747 RepID=A0A255XK23_9PROT|nr:phosphoglucosamine mutase [Elstera cyanobacteriorum]MCK6442860.1 phosphoglucosamine mutase [Elstera cyanobacteriorum]OYQ16734.1 phosphoglucosamine mutase [Elstera cyanobacteriorum]GFZ88172.1 phosphoglucosamine mutase [Elstera cyanobacteriorum]